MLRLLAYLLLATFSVAASRLRSGPGRPSWSFGFEVLVTALRRHSLWLATLDVPSMRRAAASLTAPLARGVASRTEPLAGVRVPHHVAPDMVHAFMSLGRDDAPSAQAFEAIASFVDGA